MPASCRGGVSRRETGTDPRGALAQIRQASAKAGEGGARAAQQGRPRSQGAQQSSQRRGRDKPAGLACSPCWLKKVRDRRALAAPPRRPSCRAGHGGRHGRRDVRQRIAHVPPNCQQTPLVGCAGLAAQRELERARGASTLWDCGWGWWWWGVVVVVAVLGSAAPCLRGRIFQHKPAPDGDGHGPCTAVDWRQVVPAPLGRGGGQGGQGAVNKGCSSWARCGRRLGPQRAGRLGSCSRLCWLASEQRGGMCGGRYACQQHQPSPAFKSRPAHRSWSCSMSARKTATRSSKGTHCGAAVRMAATAAGRDAAATPALDTAVAGPAARGRPGCWLPPASPSLAAIRARTTAAPDTGWEVVPPPAETRWRYGSSHRAGGQKGRRASRSYSALHGSTPCRAVHRALSGHERCRHTPARAVGTAFPPRPRLAVWDAQHGGARRKGVPPAGAQTLAGSDPACLCKSGAACCSIR